MLSSYTMQLSDLQCNKPARVHNQHARILERKRTMRPAAAGAARPLSHVYNANIANVDDEVIADWLAYHARQLWS